MTNLSELFISRIQSVLTKSSIKLCSDWSQNYRIMGAPFPGPFSFKYHPWSQEMHDSDAEVNVGMKSAQAAFTETVLNRCFFLMDVYGQSCLYILPTKTPDATDFSAARFDPALELSSYLKNFFSDVSNVGHKRAGSVNLFIRGSHSRSGLKSVPAGVIIMDEYEEMNQENLPLVRERSSGQRNKQIWKISTPRIENDGIHKDFVLSSQNIYVFRCPHCSKYIHLDESCLKIYADSLLDVEGIKKTQILCPECHHELDNTFENGVAKNKWKYLQNKKAGGTGIWVETYPREVKGWHVNQFYSSTVSPIELAHSKLLSFSDPSEEQEYYNSKLGLPHTVEGARVSDTDIQNCIKNYTMPQNPKETIVTIGIDVGKRIHYEVDEWFIPANANGLNWHQVSKPRLLEAGTKIDFEELDELIKKYYPTMCVIDANPETREAIKFSNRNFGKVFLCYYGRSVNSRDINQTKENETAVTVNRTAWLDLSLSRFMKIEIELPGNISYEYRDHIKALVKIPGKDSNKNPITQYTNTRPDHFAHARNYSEIAFDLCKGVGSARDTTIKL